MANKDHGPEIAIVGGGIAGLTLAIALHNRGIPFKIYEQASKFGEIGAGVAFTRNAIQGMKICSPAIYDAFRKVATLNQWESKKHVWFDYIDGTEQKTGHQEAKFTIPAEIGQNGVYRAAFLDELVNMVPQGVAEFSKRLETIHEDEQTKKMIMTFKDGSTREADAVVGCDGIKSKVRQAIVGQDHPCAHPVYTHKYAYRGLIPMEQAIEAIGEERALNACMHMGSNRHVLTFPVQHGKTLNLVGFVTNSDEWPDFNKLTKPVKREQALEDYEGFGPNVISLLKLCKAELDCWAIFDSHAHPLTSYVHPQYRILVSGDAAHATSPHHGAGAGFAVEDSAVLASLLSHPAVIEATGDEARKNMYKAFKVFDNVRRERTQWLVSSSRRVGDLYEWRAEGVGKDLPRIEKEINERNNQIWSGDVDEMCNQARKELEEAAHDAERDQVPTVQIEATEYPEHYDLSNYMHHHRL